MQRVAVVMPFYNASLYIKESVESILSQTFTDFNFYIIDDGSTDNSISIIEAFNDPRIILIKNFENKGIVESLNSIFKKVKEEYIVRMDADDIAILNRIEKQVQFMDSNPEIGITGSWFSILGSNELISPPLSHDEIAISLMDYSAIGHPTVIIRRVTWYKAKMQFNKNALHIEDYECWTKAVVNGIKLANIPENLLLYRKHTEQISSKFINQQNDNIRAIRSSYITELFKKLSKDEINILTTLIFNRINSHNDYLIVKQIVSKIIKNNLVFDNILLSKFLNNKIQYAAISFFGSIIQPFAQLFIIAYFDKFFYSSLSFSQKFKFPFKLTKKLLIG